MNHIFLLSSAEARRLWECLLDPPAVHLLWDDLVTLLSDLFGVERTNLFLVVPEQGQLRSRAASEFQWDIVLPWNEGIAGKVYQEKKSLLINDIPPSEFGHYFNRDPKGFQTRSMLTVPVFRDGDENEPIVMVIQLVNKIEGGFTEEDLEALKYWSRQIGVTLERTHGTEIWRHPESEPPALEDPEFDPVIPQMACRQAVLALPAFVNMFISKLGSCHVQLGGLFWTHSFWARGEMIKTLSKGYHHARLAHQLSGEPTRGEMHLSHVHSYVLRLLRWVCTLTRNELLCHMVATYEEWLGFYCSDFAAWICRTMPKERSVISSFVEDKRSHCIFYESLLLDYLMQHPRQRGEFRIYRFFLRSFYSYITHHLVKTMAHVAHRKDLPAQFTKTFRAFTDHRAQALMERAETRAPVPRSIFQRLVHHFIGLGSFSIHLFLAVLASPIALLWWTHDVPTLEAQQESLLERGQTASA